MYSIFCLVVVEEIIIKCPGEYSLSRKKSFALTFFQIKDLNMV